MNGRLEGTFVGLSVVTILEDLEAWVQSHEPHGLARWLLQSDRTGMVREGFSCTLEWYSLKVPAQPNFRMRIGRGKSPDEAVKNALAAAGYKPQEQHGPPSSVAGE